jgi:hypothetical protein
MQVRVRQRFSQLKAMDQRHGSSDDRRVPWYFVNAAQSIEDVQKDINAIVEKTIENVHKEDKPLGLLWTTPTADWKEDKEN